MRKLPERGSTPRRSTRAGRPEDTKTPTRRGRAARSARRPHKPKVVGSNPTPATTDGFLGRVARTAQGPEATLLSGPCCYLKQGTQCPLVDEPVPSALPYMTIQSAMCVRTAAVPTTATMTPISESARAGRVGTRVPRSSISTGSRLPSMTPFWKHRAEGVRCVAPLTPLGTGRWITTIHAPTHLKARLASAVKTACGESSVQAATQCLACLATAQNG